MWFKIYNFWTLLRANLRYDTIISTNSNVLGYNCLFCDNYDQQIHLENFRTIPTDWVPLKKDTQKRTNKKKPNWYLKNNKTKIYFDSKSTTINLKKPRSGNVVSSGCTPNFVHCEYMI